MRRLLERPQASGRSKLGLLIALALLMPLTIGAASGAEELAVEAINASEPTLCAERDNVTITLGSEHVRRFGIEAVLPAYIGTLASDRALPDFAHCEFGIDPSAGNDSQRITLYETFEWQLVGYRFANFWRPATTRVQIGPRSETGIHLVQLWRRFEERAEEILVLYPPDGYWRVRPLPPAHLGWTAYGSSFLIGPTDGEPRPFVDLSSVSFDPTALSFDLTFSRGGNASLRLAKLDRKRIALDLTLDPVIGRPFAALRSMFVTETNADVARIAWREPGGKAWHENRIDAFERASAVELCASRALVSRHNPSAPDVCFSDFSAAAR